MKPSCALADCIWSEQTNFCTALKQAAIPLDQKWPLLILYLRGIKENTILTENQKLELQSLLRNILEKKDFSESAFEEIERSIHTITTAYYTEKIHEITKEAAGLVRDMYAVLDNRREDVVCIAGTVDAGLAKGADPVVLLTDLRGSLKDVIGKITEDIDSLKTLSSKDSLTGLANRRAFDEFLQKAIAAWEKSKIPVSLILLDIDHFKSVNDTYGHLAGDQILQALAETLNKIFQPLATGDDEMLVARYGGEEFSIVLCGELASRAATFAEIIRKTAGKTLLLPSQQKGRGSQEKQSLTVSLGVSALCQGWKGNYQTRLIDSADKALYKAKDNGRNCTAQFIDGRYKIVSSR